MKDPYSVLGLDKSASAEQLKAKYAELRALYSEQRFMAGEAGNEGARKLQELEEAWQEIDPDLIVAEKTTEGKPDFGSVDALIRQGKYNEAQDVLDSITDRGGEWHYMQAIVFYKREWLTEAKTQLEMALQDDPGNPKYRSSLDKLNLAISNPAPNPNAQAAQQPVDPVPQQQQADMSNCLSSCCCAYCLTDCLCTTLRCC